MISASAVLSVDSVCAALGGRAVLDNITFGVEPGEFVGVIGSNGAGKTTLLRCILGLVRPTRGCVMLLGKSVRHGNRAVAYVPQRVQIDPDTSLTGRDMVALGFDGDRWGIPLPNRKRRFTIDAVLDDVGARAFADAPFGRLSGGEQQRLLVAQALLGNPKLMLLDEPLSSLDLRSANEITAIVARVTRERGVAVLLVAHDMNPLLSYMKRIVYLARGRAVIGPVQDVVTDDVLSHLYGQPVSVIRVGSRVIVVAGETTSDTELVAHAAG